MRLIRPISIAAGVAVMMVGLAACAGDGDSGGGDKLTWEDSPLNEYMAAAYGGDMSQEEQQAKLDEQTKQLENLVAECMSAEGFEYTPNLNNGGTIMIAEEGEENTYRPDDRDWVEQYGYGMVNSPWVEQQQPPGEEVVDPNQAYLDGLSDSERQAYEAALWGVQEAPAEGEEFVYDPSKAGCQGAAQQEVYGDQDLSQQEEFKPLFDAMNELYSGLEKNPAFTELDAKWASCMADGGYTDLKTQYDAQNTFSEKINEYYTALGTKEFDEKDPDYVALGEEEIKMALVDLDCREKFDYTNARLKIQFDLEKQFISEHKADLDAFKAAAEQNQ